MKDKVLVATILLFLGIAGFIGFDRIHTAGSEDTESGALPITKQSHQKWHSFVIKSKGFFDKFTLSKSSVTSRRISVGSNESVAGSLSKPSQNSNTSSAQYIFESTNNQAYNPDTKSQESRSWIYISENIANDVIRCQIQVNKVSNCRIVLNKLLGAEHMLIIDNKFYIVNYNQPVLFYCELSTTGDMTKCSKIFLPTSKNMAYVRYNNYNLLISDLNLANMVKCNLSDSLLPQNCVGAIPESASNVPAPSHYKKYSYSISYDANYTALIRKCTENNLCVTLSDVNITSPTTIKILNNMAYILDYNTNNLIGCKLQDNGDFYSCQVLKNGLNAALDIAFYTQF